MAAMVGLVIVTVNASVCPAPARAGACRAMTSGESLSGFGAVGATPIWVTSVLLQRLGRMVASLVTAAGRAPIRTRAVTADVRSMPLRVTGGVHDRRGDWVTANVAEAPGATTPAATSSRFGPPAAAWPASSTLGRPET